MRLRLALSFLQSSNYDRGHPDFSQKRNTRPRFPFWLKSHRWKDYKKTLLDWPYALFLQEVEESSLSPNMVRNCRWHVLYLATFKPNCNLKVIYRAWSVWNFERRQCYDSRLAGKPAKLPVKNILWTFLIIALYEREKAWRHIAPGVFILRSKELLYWARKPR